VLEYSLDVIDRVFWECAPAMAVEEVVPGEGPVVGYRGANSHMHLVEAYICAADALDRQDLRDRAMGITRRILDQARLQDWRVVEHYDDEWNPVLAYNENDRQHLERPYGFN